MIEPIYSGRKSVTCDNCGDGFEADNWQDAIHAMKENGWKSIVISGHWRHFCPDCKEGE